MHRIQKTLHVERRGTKGQMTRSALDSLQYQPQAPEDDGLASESEEVALDVRGGTCSPPGGWSGCSMSLHERSKRDKRDSECPQRSGRSFY